MQYGRFLGSKFQPYGIAKLSEGGVHYWRGSLDLNGDDFDQTNGLIPNFPYLDLISAAASAAS
jgi:hypothetical protein